MSKNMISEIARLLGVEIGEKFIIQNADRKETVILAMDGLRIPFPHGMAGTNRNVIKIEEPVVVLNLSFQSCICFCFCFKHNAIDFSVICT